MRWQDPWIAYIALQWWQSQDFLGRHHLGGECGGPLLLPQQICRCGWQGSENEMYHFLSKIHSRTQHMATRRAIDINIVVVIMDERAHLVFLLYLKINNAVGQIIQNFCQKKFTNWCPSVVHAKQCSAEFNLSQKYCTKFERNKQTDSKKFRPKGHRNVKRKVKIFSIKLG